jgi:hypothetical protein
MYDGYEGIMFHCYRWSKAVAAAGTSGTDATANSGGKGQGKGGKFKQGNGQWSNGKPGSNTATGGGQQTAAKGTTVRAPPPRSNGLAVCFAYNHAAGCARQKQGPQACVDAGGTVYAHVCNWFVKGVGGQPGNYCLATHSKVGNH